MANKLTKQLLSATAGVLALAGASVSNASASTFGSDVAEYGQTITVAAKSAKSTAAKPAVKNKNAVKIAAPSRSKTSIKAARLAPKEPSVIDTVVGFFQKKDVAVAAPKTNKQLLGSTAITAKPKPKHADLTVSGSHRTDAKKAKTKKHKLAQSETDPHKLTAKGRALANQMLANAKRAVAPLPAPRPALEAEKTNTLMPQDVALVEAPKVEAATAPIAAPAPVIEAPKVEAAPVQAVTAPAPAPVVNAPKLETAPKPDKQEVRAAAKPRTVTPLSEAKTSSVADQVKSTYQDVETLAAEMISGIKNATSGFIDNHKKRQADIQIKQREKEEKATKGMLAELKDTISNAFSANTRAQDAKLIEDNFEIRFPSKAKDGEPKPVRVATAPAPAPVAPKAAATFVVNNQCAISGATLDAAGHYKIGGESVSAEVYTQAVESLLSTYYKKLASCAGKDKPATDKMLAEFCAATEGCQSPAHAVKIMADKATCAMGGQIKDNATGKNICGTQLSFRQ